MLIMAYSRHEPSSSHFNVFARQTCLQSCLWYLCLHLSCVYFWTSSTHEILVLDELECLVSHDVGFPYWLESRHERYKGDSGNWDTENILSIFLPVKWLFSA